MTDRAMTSYGRGASPAGDADGPSRRPAGRRTAATALLAAALLAAAAGGAAAAQDEPAAPAAPPPGGIEVQTTVVAVPEAPDLVVEDGVVRLQLEEAVLIALRRNLDLAVERYSHEQALIDIVGAEGIYDLFASATANLSDEDSPSVSQVAGVPVLTSDDRSLSFGLSQLTAWGGEARYRLIASRSSTNNRDQPVNPLYFGDTGVEFEQPFLRGFGRLATERPILLARLGAGTSREIFEQQVALVIQQVEDAYWNLVESREQLVVARESLALARELHDRNRIQVDVGTLAPIELVQSEATIAEREEGIISAEAAAADAADRLLELLNLPRALIEDLGVEPITEPETVRVDVDLEQAIATALAERPEVRQQQLELERLELESRFAQNQKLPQANVTFGYGSAGIAGRGRIPQPDGSFQILDSDLADAFQTVRDRDFDGWSIGLLFGVPIQNRTARAAATRADLGLERGRTQLEQLELSIVTEVRTAARAVRTALQQIESARASVTLQERNLDAERKRYENGMSDSFRITEIQNDLTAARSRLVSSVAAYRRALTDYYRTTGRLLEEHGVVLQGPVDVELPPRRLFSLLD